MALPAFPSPVAPGRRSVVATDRSRQSQRSRHRRRENYRALPRSGGPGSFPTIFHRRYVGVSKNRGTSKRMVCDGKPLLKWMIWGYHYFLGNIHIFKWWVLMNGASGILSRWWQLKYVLFSPRTLGKCSNFDEHIFQRGWFNHQLVCDTPWKMNG